MNQQEASNLLDDLLDSGESEVIEFKEATKTYDREKLGKYVSALSNEANLRGKTQALNLSMLETFTMVAPKKMFSNHAHLMGTEILS